MLKAISQLRTRTLLSVNQKTRLLATSSRQIRGAQPSLIETDHDFAQFHNVPSKLINNNCQQNDNKACHF